MAQHLVLETLDRDKLVGKVAIHRWALELGYGDRRNGVRPGKCQAVFESLVNRRLVNWNRVGAPETGPDGTFEWLPDYGKWDTDGERSLGKTEPKGTGELPFCVSRELDEALASTSRDRAVQMEQQAPSGPSQDQRLLQQPPPGRPALDWAGAAKAAVDDPAEGERMIEELRRQSKGLEGSEASGKDRGINPPVGRGINPPVQKAQPGDYSPGATEAPQTLVESGPGDYSPGGPLGDRRRLGDPPKRPGDYSPGDSSRGGEVSKPKGGGNKPSPEVAWEFLQKIDRRGTLKGWLRPDYEALCREHFEYVLGYLKECFRNHERRYGEGPQRLKDPVGWLGKHAARVGKIRWHSKV
jgi:hypothetical protein